MRNLLTTKNHASFYAIYTCIHLFVNFLDAKTVNVLNLPSKLSRWKGRFGDIADALHLSSSQCPPLITFHDEFLPTQVTMIANIPWLGQSIMVSDQKPLPERPVNAGTANSHIDTLVTMSLSSLRRHFPTPATTAVTQITNPKGRGVTLTTNPQDGSIVTSQHVSNPAASHQFKIQYI